jgi:hypothetical protein
MHRPYDNRREAHAQSGVRRVLSVACRLQVLSSSPVAGVLGSLVYLGLDGEGVFECFQPPRSAILTEARAAYGRGQVV